MIQRLSTWGVTDWVATTLWLASILLLFMRSIKPWALHWGKPLVDIEIDGHRSAVMPGLIVAGPIFLALMLAIAQLSPRPGLPNLWLTPGRLLGFAPFMILMVFFAHSRFRAALLRATPSSRR